MISRQLTGSAHCFPYGHSDGPPVSGEDADIPVQAHREGGVLGGFKKSLHDSTDESVSVMGGDHQHTAYQLRGPRSALNG